VKIGRRARCFLSALTTIISDDNPVRVIEVFVDELDLGTLGIEGSEPKATGRAHFYDLSKSGDAPAVMRVGRRTLISAEAAAEWRRRVEEAARGAPPRTPEVKLGAHDPH
jgi:hypothetical protein